MKLAILSVVAAAAGVLAAVWLPAPEGGVAAWALLLLVLGLLLRGTLSMRSGLVEPTAWRSEDPTDRRVGLSFDDGPHPEWTPRVLDALRAERVHATFFLIGENVRRHPGLARRIHAEGHEVACHADTHSPWTPFFTPSRMGAEIRACLEAVRADAGVTPRLYRPPFGIRSPAHHGVVRHLDLFLVGMARRGMDKVRSMTAGALARRVVGRARPGEILALHDGDEPGRSTGRCLTADALPEILRGLRGLGMEPVPVSTLMVERPYRESPRRGWSGRTRGGRFGNAFFVHAVRLLGPGPTMVAASVVAAWFAAFAGEGRRASIDLRRRLHGRGGWLAESLWVYRHFRTYGRTLLWRLDSRNPARKPPRVEREGFDDVLRETVERPGPLLIVSAHLGDWSGASRTLLAEEKRGLWVVAFRGTGVGPHQVAAGAAAEKKDARYHLIDVESPPGDVALAMTAALGAGDVVAMHADRVMDERDGLRVPFLGAEARLPRGVWNVAMVTGAPAVVLFAIPLSPDHVVMRWYGPIRVPRVPRERREEAVAAAVREYAGFLEDCLRRHPLHWGNFYDFWKA